MAVKNKPVLGYRQCPDCGTRATIHQAGGRRGALYQRCGCGCVQSNGALVQSRMWFETEWLSGLQPATPPASALDLQEYQAQLAAVFQRHGVATGQFDRIALENTGNSENSNTGQQTDISAVTDQPDESVKPVKTKPKTGLLLLLAAGAGLAVLSVMRAAA